jgi:hypothetical protein
MPRISACIRQEHGSASCSQAFAGLLRGDRPLVQVLHYLSAEIGTEIPAAGGFADYVCRVQDRSRLVVESKRDGRSLGCEGRPAGAALKSSGGVFKADTAKEGVAQAISYWGPRTPSMPASRTVVSLDRRL